MFRTSQHVRHGHLFKQRCHGKKRYSISDEIWALIKRAWASTGGIAYAKALKMAAEKTRAKLPSKGAVATYAKRNNWQRGHVPVQAKPMATRNNSDRRLPKIEATWEVDNLGTLEARFVEECVVDRNATRSARRRAGYRDTMVAVDAAQVAAVVDAVPRAGEI